MDDSDDSASDVSETTLAHFDDDELPRLPDEIAEDWTDGIDDFLSDEGSLSSLSLADGSPVIKPRPYQFEMVEESLKKNIIVAVCAPFWIEDEADKMLRWTQAVAKPMCTCELLNFLSMSMLFGSSA